MRGDRVLYRGYSRPSAVAALLAIQWIRGTAVPLDPQAAPEAVHAVYIETEASCLLSDRPADQKLPDMRCMSLQDLYENAVPMNLSFEDPGPYPAVNHLVENSAGSRTDAEEIGEILFTSGSTGKPKGVMLSRKALYHIMKNTAEGIGFREEDVLLLPLPLYHSFGLRELSASLYRGALVVLQNGFTFSGDLQENLRRYACTRFATVPAGIELLRKQLGSRFYETMHGFKSIEVSAGALSPAQRSWLVHTLPDTVIWNVWGSSETGGALFLNVTEAVLSGIPQRIKAAGKPCPGVKVKIIPDAERCGRLALQGSMLLSGYWKQPERTAGTLQNGWCITGDAAEIDADGYVHLLGRADSMINMGGEKIAPYEIETAAEESGLLSECACIGVPDPQNILGEVPILLCVPRDTDDFMNRMNHFLRVRLSEKRMPRYLLALDVLPRNAAGKINRAALLQIWNERNPVREGEKRPTLSSETGGSQDNNPVIRAILTRKSIRHFTDQSIPKEVIDLLLRAACQAPSGHNLQTWHFTVLQRAQTIRILRECTTETVQEKRTEGDLRLQFFGWNNPACLILISNDRRNPDGCQDASCAAENLFLAAHSLGIGSVWLNTLMTISDVPRIRALLDGYGIPGQHIVWCTAALGYPDHTAEQAAQPQRRKDVIRFADCPDQE
jgi:long-chain acyl-CoA synthetase